jgi:eukaryotic-like serine/threonine-protein kinase
MASAPEAESTWKSRRESRRKSRKNSGARASAFAGREATNPINCDAVKLGPYRLLRRIATGGMAEVFLARRQGARGFHKLVAVKRILPHLADLPELRSMFVAEASLAARVDHPGVVQTFELGEAGDGAPYLAMEYVHGSNLLTVSRRGAEMGRPLPTRLAPVVVAAAAEALHHVHELRDDDGHPLRVVHRDVTPGNLLLSFDGAVKLADFGVALVGAGRTGASLQGTCRYMAPEHRRGEAIDRRADVYALGILLHELSSGSRLSADAGDDRPRLAEPRLEAVCRRALAADPAARFATAQDLCGALEETGLLMAAHRARRDLASYLAELFGADALAPAHASLPPETIEPTAPLPDGAMVPMVPLAAAAPPRRRRVLPSIAWVGIAAALFVGKVLALGGQK